MLMTSKMMSLQGTANGLKRDLKQVTELMTAVSFISLFLFGGRAT